MNTQNNTIVIALVTLVLGLLIGYGAAVSTWETTSVEVGTMHGAMGSMTMGLEGKTGDALDRAFLDEMIIHHQGAVEMAQMLLTGTSRPELIKLGNDIITAQTGEIRMMQDWREQWFTR